MSYAGATGHNNAAGLVTFSPQPACNGIAYPVRRHVGSGLVLVDGAAMATLVFNVLQVSEYSVIMAALGLSMTDVSDESGLVTVSLPGPDRVTFSNYNGTVFHNRLDTKFEDHLYRDVKFLLTDLVALT